MKLIRRNINESIENQADIIYRLEVSLLSQCFALLFGLFGESHAGLFGLAVALRQCKKKSEQIKPVEQAKNFTISKIEPNLKEGFISV